MESEPMPRKYAIFFYGQIATSILAWLVALIVTDGNRDAARIAGGLPLAAAGVILLLAAWERIARGKVNK